MRVRGGSAQVERPKVEQTRTAPTTSSVPAAATKPATSVTKLDAPVPLDSVLGAKLLQECKPQHLSDLATSMRHVQVPAQLSEAGLATATYVLNSLGGTPRPLLPQYEKGGYEYVSQDWLKSQVTHDKNPKTTWGMTLDKLGSTLSGEGVDTRVTHAHSPPGKNDVAKFRGELISAIEDPGKRAIVNFQMPDAPAGKDGRFGPVVAYNEKRDLFCVYELSSGKAQPLWLSAEQLYASMATRDSVAKDNRGWLIASHRKGVDPATDHTAPVSDEFAGKLLYFDSPEGMALLKGSKRDMVSDFTEYLAHSQIQDDVFSCGRASVAMMLSAGGLPTTQDDVLTLLGPKKAEQMFSGKGLSLDDLAAAAIARGAKAEVFRSEGADGLDTFRREAKAAIEEPGRYAMVNFDRKGLGQAGSGHHSPIAAYNEKTDMFLVYDVASFKTDSFWVKADALYAASATVDGDFGTQRGLLVVSTG